MLLRLSRCVDRHDALVRKANIFRPDRVDLLRAGGSRAPRDAGVCHALQGSCLVKTRIATQDGSRMVYVLSISKNTACATAQLENGKLVLCRFF